MQFIPEKEPFYDMFTTPEQITGYIEMLYKPAQDLADLIGKPVD